MISTTQFSTTTLAFPLYDGHGNMVATITRNSGMNGYVKSNERTYDVWGSVRSGAATGDPTKRYCANLGHQADDESDLTYMRARYYEPGSGRFINEDPSCHGTNWFLYTTNDPVNKVDSSGRFDEWAGMFSALGLLFAAAAFYEMNVHITGATPLMVATATMTSIGLMGLSMACFALALGATCNSLGMDAGTENMVALYEVLTTTKTGKMMATLFSELKTPSKLARIGEIGRMAAALWFAHTLRIAGMVALLEAKY